MNVHFRCDISLFDCDMQTSNKIQSKIPKWTWSIAKWTWSIATTTEKKKELHNVHWVSKNNTQHIATAELNIVKCCVTHINDCIRNVTLVATGLCVCFGFGKNWIGYHIIHVRGDTIALHGLAYFSILSFFVFRNDYGCCCCCSHMLDLQMKRKWTSLQRYNSFDRIRTS